MSRHRAAAFALAMTAVGCRSAQPAGDSRAPFGPPGEEHQHWSVVGFPMAYHVWRDSIDIVMYPPQAPPPTQRWRVAGNTIEMSDGKRMDRMEFAIRGDVLETRAEGMTRQWRRLSQSSAPQTVVGTWENRQPQITTILTFRSDSLVVMEVGAPRSANPTLRGDLLELSNSQVRMTSKLRRARDTVYVEPQGERRGTPFKLVRRPWGCFGIKELDGAARECR